MYILYNYVYVYTYIYIYIWYNFFCLFSFISFFLFFYYFLYYFLYIYIYIYGIAIVTPNLPTDIIRPRYYDMYVLYIYIYMHFYTLYISVYTYIYIYIHTQCSINTQLIMLYTLNLNVPNLPTNIIPTKIARLKLSGKSPVGLGIPPLIIILCLSRTLRNPQCQYGNWPHVQEQYLDNYTRIVLILLINNNTIYIYIYIYIYMLVRRLAVLPVHLLRVWVSEGLTQANS